jgi:hypothetical protein
MRFGVGRVVVGVAVALMVGLGASPSVAAELDTPAGVTSGPTVDGAPPAATIGVPYEGLLHG